jgi:parallel beta-helix repeat protein
MNTKSFACALRVLFALAFALSLAGVPVMPASATGVHLYVAVTGSNSGPNNCQTQVSPCLTVTYAISQATADDIIHIAAGTYVENITMNKSLSFIGAGMNLTILDGGGSGRVIAIPTLYTISMSDLTIQNGNTSGANGGGISSFGILSLTRVKVTGNSADSGGGIFSAAPLSMVDCEVSNNHATGSSGTGYGGGIEVSAGSSNISRTTISNNTATGYSGGIHVQGSSTHYLINVTISGNTATTGGGMTNTGGATTNITNSTIANNLISSGTNYGIVNYSTINFTNTIVAYNSTYNCVSGGGTWTSLGYNLDSASTCGFTQTGDLQNTDPQLGSLGNNGGPTQTQALPIGSPAIDAGTNTGCPATDQRGAPRPYGSTCDIGAYEYFLPTISGNAGVGGATLGYFDGSSQQATADGSGHYSFTVSYNWSGTVTPYKPDYSFSPNYLDYGNLQTNAASQNYTATPTVYTATYTSDGAYDGHILESGENTTAGGTLDSTSPTFNLGDDASDKQYRGILSFNTAALPNNAVITRVILKLRKQGLMGTDPFTILGGLKVDIRKSYFGTGLGLVASDFQAVAGKSNVATFKSTPKNNWYFAVIGSAGYSQISLNGTTQFRLRFLTDDNNNNAADYMKFFTGDYSNTAARPTLVITYTIP